MALMGYCGLPEGSRAEDCVARTSKLLKPKEELEGAVGFEPMTATV
jgi:hypothetical protein